jgi:hypothetical protein
VNEYPFSVFRRADRACYSVSFKDASGRYLRPVSTGKTTEAEARQTAFLWLRDGIPQRRTSVQSHELNVSQMALQDFARKIESKADMETVLKELRRRGWLKSYVLAGTPVARNFVDFLVEFWDWDK